MKDWLRDPEEFENRMRDKDHGEWPLSRRGEFRHEEGQYGRPYGEYLEARRHYTESHSAMDKADMDKYAGEHLMSAMTTIRTIYGDATLSCGENQGGLLQARGGHADVISKWIGL